MTHPDLSQSSDIGGPVPATDSAVSVSVIVPVSERPLPLERIYSEFAPAIADSGRAFEFIFIVQPWGDQLVEPLRELARSGEPIRVLEIGQGVGDATALSAASIEARGDIILTLPAYYRVSPEALNPLIQAVEEGFDLVSARRIRNRESVFNRFQSRVFHAILRWGVGGHFRDVASGVQAIRRSALSEIPLYGDFFRFLPLLAQREGFRVKEVDVDQHPDDRVRRVYGPGVYLRRLIDVLGLVFLVRFTEKPLRFFGLLGSLISLAGIATLAVITAQRFAGRGLADRPLLLLGVLLLVVGIQAIGIGLVGEIIVHLGASRRRAYRLRED